MRVGKVLATGTRRSIWLAYARRGGRAYASSLLPTRDPAMFCIATTPRTGSELLVGLSNQHPKIRCDSEIMNYQPQFPHSFIRGKAKTAALRGSDAYGFKLMAYHVMNYFNVPDRRLVTRLASHGCRFIHLRRRNLLAQVVSFFRASISQEWHRDQSGRLPGTGLSDAEWKAEFAPIAWRLGSQTLDDVTIGVPLKGPITIDVPTLLFALRLIDIQNAALTWMLQDLPVRTLWYEDHLESPEDHQATFDDLCRWLKLDPLPVKANLRKMAASRLEDEVANLDEVRRALESTRYAPLADANGDR